MLAMTMSKKSESYSEDEADLGHSGAALKAAVNTPPKPLKSMTPKRPTKQPTAAKKKRR